MAIGRSNSLSINTTGSLFGNNNTSQGQQSAGPFGSSTNASQPPSFGASSQPQTGGLFGGSTTAQASQPPQTTSLFGQTQASTTPQSSTLFGGLSKPAASGNTGGSLFGGALGVNTQPGQNQIQNPAQSSGLFSLGQPAQQNLGLPGASTRPAGAPSLFGNQSTGQNQASTPSLFGQSQQTQPQQQNTMFGGLGQSQNRAFGTTLSGVQQPVQTNLDSLKGTTRFVDTHPDVQNSIEQFDNAIQRHISHCEQIRETLPQTQAAVESVAPDVAYIEQFLSTTQLGIENDAAQISQLKDIVRKDADDAMLSFRALNNMRLPAQFHYGNRSNFTSSTAKTSSSPHSADKDDPTKPVDLIGYFSRRTEDLSSTLDLYQRQIREIEAHLRTMEAGTVEKAQQLTGGRNGLRDQRRELDEALKAIEGAIFEAAKKVSQTRDLVTQQTLGSAGTALR